MIEDSFLRIWFGMQRIGVCGNCCGIATIGADAHWSDESTDVVALNEGDYTYSPAPCALQV